MTNYLSAVEVDKSIILEKRTEHRTSLWTVGGILLAALVMVLFLCFVVPRMKTQT